MFKEELAALKDAYLARFNLVHVLSREAQDIELLHGRIDRAKAESLLRHWVRARRHRRRVRLRSRRHDAGGRRRAQGQRLSRGEDPDRAVRDVDPAPRAPAAARSSPAHAQCEVTVIIDGATRTFMLDKAKENIIDAGLRSGVELPYSCKGGVCSTCRAKLVAGEVDMDVNFALEDYEVARGFVLTCQSYPVTDRVTVDYDQTA